MKYYQISPDSEPEIIGVKNGIYQVEINKDEILKQQQFKEFITFFKGNATEVYHNQDRISNFIIPPIKGKMLKKAKVTDIMGYTQKISFIDYLYIVLNILTSLRNINYLTIIYLM